MTMYLVQLLLPLADNDGQPFPAAHYDSVRDELTRRFGGLTAYSRAPAVGLWGPDADRATQDDVVVYEVMADTLDRAWWRSFRETLERRFAQDALVVRAHEVERL
ncbi:MAG TPA: hypothetical protein VGB53_15660 [Rubricoccaceae bacterium]|jgi:hypothetical protein